MSSGRTTWRVAKLSPDGPWLESVSLTVSTDAPEVVDAIEMAAHRAGVILGREPDAPPHLRSEPEQEEP